MSQRHAVTKKLAATYKRATKSEKTVMLDELVGSKILTMSHAPEEASP
jgi:hypothetical protein